MAIQISDHVESKTPAQVVAGFIDEVWGQIADDVMQALNMEGDLSGRVCVENVVEMCVDANRMETMLHRDEDREAAKAAIAVLQESTEDWNGFLKAVAAELPYRWYS